MNDAIEFRLDDLGHRFTAHALRGREALSRPYRFDVDFFTARRVPAELKTLVGRPATVAMPIPGGGARLVRGVVAAQRLVGHGPHGGLSHGDRQQVRVRVVPRFALLRHRVASRVFQDRTVVDVVAVVLGRMRVRSRLALSQTYPRLEHCVQHRESDHDFVARILADHGIAYWFEHPDDPAGADHPDDGRTLADREGLTLEGVERGTVAASRVVSEVMVLSDRAAAFPALAGEVAGARRSPSLVFERAHDAPVSGPSVVTEFAWADRARPTAVSLRGYDFMNPLAVAAAQAATHDPTSPEAPTAAERLGLEVHDHDDEHPAPFADRRGARVALERARADALIGEGASRDRRLLPGHRFTLEEHPAAELNREYAVTWVDHEAFVPEFTDGDARPLYTNRFRCVAADREWRPALRPRPRHQGLETARVVGPEGEAVHTDALGRVRVHFPWDRGGGADDGSCWIRVAQSWAGAGYGAQFIPRVGMEALVAFLDGDPDRPVVVGCLYNGLNGAAFAVPDDRTRSGWRTRSEPGHDGNELSFEDRSGAEQFLVRASRDLDVEVRRDARSTVAGDASARVEGARAESVGADLTVRVGGAHALDARDERVRIARGSDREVGGARTEVVLGDGTSSVGGRRLDATGGDHELLVTGSLRVRADARPRGADGDEAPGVAIDSGGALSLRAARGAHFDAEDGVTLSCGASRIELRPDGIRVMAPKVTVLAGDEVALRASEAFLTLGDDATLHGREARVQGASADLHLGDDARLRGSTVHLGHGASHGARATVDEAMREARRSRIRVSVRTGRHHEGAPAGELWILNGEGTVIDVRTASQGEGAGATRTFGFEPSKLPDPVEMLWVEGVGDDEVRRHVLGPCSPRALADDLADGRHHRARAVVAKRASRRNGGRR